MAAADCRQLCPFDEKCYRKNPIHFQEMAHPYLEKLLDEPDEKLLEIECTDRSLLLDQLKVLRMVMSKRHQSSLESSPPPPPPPSKKPKVEDEGSSIFSLYSACTTQKAREDIRLRAIARLRESGQTIPHLASIGEFSLKYALSSPYNIFLPCVQKVPETYNQPLSVTFPELLDISLGEISESLHFNFMVDVGWLCLQYLLSGQAANCLILLGERCDDSPLPSSIKTVLVPMPSAWGTHHSKISILKYTNGGARIIISTANLYSDDWDNRTQALWMSPHLPKLSSSDIAANTTSTGESRTGFKQDFIAYLKYYKQPGVLETWISFFETLDFSSVDVFFIASVPGIHKGPDKSRWALGKIRTILSNHAELPPADGFKWPVVAQCSSIGSLGPSYDSWLTQDFIPAMASEKMTTTTRGLPRSLPNFKFIYPSINNYRASFDSQVGSCCLPYSLKTHQKQMWLLKYLHQWKSGEQHRDRALPHSKTYTRLSPDLKKIPWAVITSGNLSKAAWGYGKTSTTILNYEAGVLFLPQFLTGNSKTFPIKKADENGTPPFPMTYDVPLTPYLPSDEAFVMELFQHHQ